MDFRLDADIEEFRAEVQAFLREAMSPAAVAGHADPSDLTGLDAELESSLHRAAGARGWLELPLEQQAVFNFEVARADAPLIDTAMTLAGQVVAAHGSAQQREQLLARMAAGETQVCIAYSEEGAGSDLSAIATTAQPDGDAWVLSGRKVLVTGAHKADWCCTVARTNRGVPARQGMTMFLVDMASPGVRMTRRETMNGWTLGEIHFDGVRVGPDAVLGEVDAGWRQLVSAVAAERSGMFWLGFARHVLDLLLDHVRRADRDGAPLRDDPIARDTVARLEIGFADAERLARRALWVQAGGHSDIPLAALAAMAKVAATELLQQIAQAATELAGLAALLWAPLFAPDPPPGAAAGGRFTWEYMERVHGTISVGANELQRDVIAQAGLRLPRRAS